MERDKVGVVYYGDYTLSVERMVDYFFSKHSIKPHDRVWVGNVIGGVLDTIEYTIPFSDIEVDIRLSAPKGLYMQYLNDMDLYLIGGGSKPMNYESYIRGLRFNNV